ncbi:hypothetical protein GCM10010411_76220 [Actinomadura fulvescens]|uniref:UDP-N-acetylglucosamine kinase n=1 Tax=Actinomadura fulvescens TaxID=46160 RepID=A0ABP6CU96_9ACTN
MTHEELTPLENARIFRDEIWPAVAGPGASLASGPAQRREGEPPPRATWIIAPPAHLKSTLQSTMTAQASVDADTFAAHHPAYETLALEDDRSAQFKISGDLARWYDLSILYAMQQKLDLVVSGWHAEASLQMMSDGWETEAIFIAGDEAICNLRRLKRYTEEREIIGYGRWVPLQDYSDFYHADDGWTIDDIYRNRLVNRITVLDRTLQPVHTNPLNADDPWDQEVSPRSIVEQLRREPWSAAEFNEAYELIDYLLYELADDLLPELQQAIRTAKATQQRTVDRFAAEAAKRIATVERGEGPAVRALGPQAHPDLVAQAQQADEQAIAELQARTETYREEARTLDRLESELGIALFGRPPERSENSAYRPPGEFSLEEWHRSYTQSI